MIYWFFKQSHHVFNSIVLHSIFFQEYELQNTGDIYRKQIFQEGYSKREVGNESSNASDNENEEMFLVLEDIKKEIEDYWERFKLLKTKGFEYPDDEVTTVRIKILVLNYFFSKLNVF